MKKKVLCYIMAFTLSLSIAACGKENPETGDTNAAPANSTTNTDTDASSEETADAQNASQNDVTFWYNRQTWREPTDSFEGGLFNDSITLPLDLNTLDSCSAPYEWFPNGGSGQNAASISEILTSSELLQPNSSPLAGPGTTVIFTQTSYVDGKNVNYDEIPDNIGNIYLYNFSDSELPASTCYENGWWFTSSAYFIDEFLQIDYTSESESDTYKLDAVVKKFGTPSYIGCLETNDFETQIEQTGGGLSYSLIYVYPDFTLEIMVNEFLIQQQLSTDLVGVYYYPAACWEEIQKDYSRFDMKLYDVK